MNREELSKVPFQFMSHLNMEHEHCSSYSNMDYGFHMCKHTKCIDGIACGRTYTHYMYEGKVYKSLPKFLEAIKDVEFKGDKEETK